MEIFISKLQKILYDCFCLIDTKFVKRKRKITSEVVFNFIAKKLQSGESYNTIITDLHASAIMDRTQKKYSASSMIERRTILGSDAFLSLFETICELSSDDFSPEIEHIAVDGSWMEVNNHFKKLFDKKYKGTDGHSASKGYITTLYSIERNHPLGICLDDLNSERTNFCKLFSSTKIKKGSVFIFDRGYYSQEMFNFLHNSGMKFIFRVPSGKTCMAPVSFLINNKKNYYKREKKEGYTLTTVKHKIQDSKGKYTWMYFMTNTDYDRKQIGEIYHKRWKIEEFYKFQKHTLNLEKPNTRTESLYIQEIHTSAILVTMMELLSMKKLDILNKKPIQERAKLLEKFTINKSKYAKHIGQLKNKNKVTCTKLLVNHFIPAISFKQKYDFKQLDEMVDLMCYPKIMSTEGLDTHKERTAQRTIYKWGRKK